MLQRCSVVIKHHTDTQGRFLVDEVLPNTHGLLVVMQDLVRQRESHSIRSSVHSQGGEINLILQKGTIHNSLIFKKKLTTMEQNLTENRYTL